MYLCSPVGIQAVDRQAAGDKVVGGTQVAVEDSQLEEDKLAVVEEDKQGNPNNKVNAHTIIDT